MPAPEFDPTQPFTTEGSTTTTTDQPQQKPEFDPTQDFTQASPASQGDWLSRNVLGPVGYVGREAIRGLGDNWLAYNLAKAGAPELGIMPPDPSTVPQTFQQWKSLAPPPETPPGGVAGSIAGLAAAPVREYTGSFGPLNLLMPVGSFIGSELGEGAKQLGASPLVQGVANLAGSGGYGLAKTLVQRAAESIPSIVGRQLQKSGGDFAGDFSGAIRDAKQAFEGMITQAGEEGGKIDQDAFQYVTHLLGDPDNPKGAVQGFIDGAKTDLQKLRDMFPKAADQLGAWHANEAAKNPSIWKSLSPADKEALIPDAGDRAAMDSHFKEPGATSKFIHGAATGSLTAAGAYGIGKALEAAGVPSEWVDPFVEYAKPYLGIAGTAFGKGAAQLTHKLLGSGAERVPGMGLGGFMQQFWQTPEGQNQLNKMVEPHITATHPATVGGQLNP